MCPAKTQINLGIRHDQSSLCAQGVAKDSSFPCGQRRLIKQGGCAGWYESSMGANEPPKHRRLLTIVQVLNSEESVGDVLSEWDSTGSKITLNYIVPESAVYNCSVQVMFWLFVILAEILYMSSVSTVGNLTIYYTNADNLLQWNGWASNMYMYIKSIAWNHYYHRVILTHYQKVLCLYMNTLHIRQNHWTVKYRSLWPSLFLGKTLGHTDS